MNKVLRVKATMAKTGLSRSSVYKLSKAGKFAPKIQISERAIGFLESDLDAWIASKSEASNGN